MQRVLGLVDDPAGPAVGDRAARHLRRGIEEAHIEHTAVRLATVGRGPRDARSVFEVEILERVLAGEIGAAGADVVVERAAGLQIDDVGGDRHRIRRDGVGADDGDLVGEGAGDDARGGSVGHGGVASGLGDQAHGAAVALEVLVLRDIEGELRGVGPLVVGLEVNGLLLAVVVVVPRLVIPDGRGAVEQVGAVEDGLESAHRVFRIEHVERGAEVALATQDTEDLLVREVQDRVRAMLRTHRRLLQERRSPAHGKIVGGAAVLLHRERRARLEVDRAPERVGAFVGRLALDEFDCLEHRAGDRLQFERAREAVGGQ